MYSQDFVLKIHVCLRRMYHVGAEEALREKF